MKYSKLLLVVAFFTLLFSAGCDAEVTNLSVDPTSYDYGHVSIGDSIGYIFSIYNSSNNACRIKNITISGSGSSEFAISSGSTSEIFLPAREEYNVTVTFSPQTYGTRRAIMRVLSNLNAEFVYTSIELLGFGQKAPQISVPDQNYSFGSIYINDYKEHTFDVTNTGTAELRITDYTFLGVGQSYYSISAGLAPLVIQPNQTGQFTVKCEPTIVGNFPAILEVTHNGSKNNPFRINLYMASMDFLPEFEIKLANPYYYGVIPVNSSKTISLKVENNGNAPLTISNITMQTGSEFIISSMKDINNNPVNLPCAVKQGEYMWVMVKFTPKSTGSFQDKVQFDHNGVNTTSSLYEFEVKGDGN